MHTKQLRAFLPGLLLAALLTGLSGCGWRSTSSQAGAGNTPDRVQIAIHVLDAQSGKPVVTLATVSQVQQLYTTVTGLPILSQDLPCTADFGPSYTLTFSRKGQTLATATAQHYGCGDVSITGENQTRQASQDFWSQLSQAIYQATPVARPEQLALLHTLQLNQPPQTAQITSTATTQRLYQAILALPQASQSDGCVSEPLHEYQLIFQAAKQAISSSIDKKCNTISLEGNYLSRSGTFVMNDQFKHLFEQTLAAATFAPANPDQLTLLFQPVNGVARQSTIADAGLRQQLYTKIFTLPTGETQPNCPSGEDKVTGKGKWYTLSFMQWHLPVLVDVDAYEGSCLLLSLDANQGMGAGQVLQGDEAFWNLVHQAANVG